MTSIRMVIAGCILVVLVGILVLLGWTFDLAMLTGNIAGKVAMNPLTALLFVLAGVSLFFLRSPHISQRIRMLASLLAWSCVVLGAIRLGGYLSGSAVVREATGEFAEEIRRRSSEIPRVA